MLHVSQHGGEWANQAGHPGSASIESETNTPAESVWPFSFLDSSRLRRHTVPIGPMPIFSSMRISKHPVAVRLYASLAASPPITQVEAKRGWWTVAKWLPPCRAILNVTNTGTLGRQNRGSGPAYPLLCSTPFPFLRPSCLFGQIFKVLAGVPGTQYMYTLCLCLVSACATPLEHPCQVSYVQDGTSLVQLFLL